MTQDPSWPKIRACQLSGRRLSPRRADPRRTGRSGEMGRNPGCAECAKQVFQTPAAGGVQKPDTPPEVALIIIIMCRHPPELTYAFWVLEGFSG